MMLAIPRLPMGNFASVLRMVRRVGGDAQLVESASGLRHADRIILAGVGAFDHGVRSLREGGWVDALHEAVYERQVPILGICLGMQLMCKSSEEGSLPGMGWIDAEVRRFRLPADTGLKVPHMGWNTVRVTKPNRLIFEDDGEQRYYFVHSYHVDCRDSTEVLATTHHGSNVTAAFCRANIYGVQFHPEKSHRFGMALMKRYLEL